MLVTNLRLADLRTSLPCSPTDRWVVGFRDSIGYWMVLGASHAVMPADLALAARDAAGHARAGLLRLDMHRFQARSHASVRGR